VDIKKIVETTLTRRQESSDKEHKREIGIYWASESWSCLRKKFYRFHNTPKERPDNFGVMLMGVVSEEAFYEILRDHYNEDLIGNDVPIEVKDGLKYIIVGKTDPVVYTDETKKKIRLLFEVKTQTSVKWKAQPSIHHIHQLMCYLKGLNLPSAQLVYISRNDICDVKSFEIKFDPKIWQEVVTHFNLYHGYLEKNELPPPTPMMEFECNPVYCPYVERCIADKSKEESDGE
jgi:CRISPR/Cas system-associated exonuclease Cas4 (RecB family)